MEGQPHLLHQYFNAQVHAQLQRRVDHAVGCALGARLEKDPGGPAPALEHDAPEALDLLGSIRLSWTRN